MTFTAPTDDIIVQEGTFAFDFDASGAITKGQAVYANKDGLGVAAPLARGTIQPGCVGVAAYTVATTKPVAVYGIGNICRVIVSGTCQAGDILFCGSEGKVTLAGNFDNPIVEPSGVYFIALDHAAANGDDIRAYLI
jgi:hypothetical protein